MVSLAYSVVSPSLTQKVQVEQSLYEDLLGSICQNQYLLCQLMGQWIPRSSCVHWQRDLPVTDTSEVRFDASVSCAGVRISEEGRVVENANPNRMKFNVAVMTPALENGVYEVRLRVEQDRMGDEMICLGVCTLPLSNLNYEESEDMWVYRCYNGECYEQGKKTDRVLERLHMSRKREACVSVDDSITLTVDTLQSTLAIKVNDTDYGVVFRSLPPAVFPFVLFYNSQPPQRCVRCENVRCLGQAEASFSRSIDCAESDTIFANMPLLVHHLTE